jgi:hypothetical protein
LELEFDDVLPASAAGVSANMVTISMTRRFMGHPSVLVKTRPIIRSSLSDCPDWKLPCSPRSTCRTPVVRIRICVTAMLVKPLTIVKRELQAAGGDRSPWSRSKHRQRHFFRQL